MNHAMDESTGLRAEVPPFVPTRNRIGMNNIGSDEALPPYLTSCYPFVQENDPRALAYSHHVGQWQINTPRSAWQSEVPMYTNYRSFPGSPPATPSLIIRNPNLVGHATSPGYGRQLQESTRNFSVFRNNDYPGLRQQHPMTSHNNQKRILSKKSSRRNVGVQKEANMQASSTSRPMENEDSPIMEDFSQQTDFPLGIANNSFRTDPSPLFKKLHRSQKTRNRQQNRQDSSSSEDDVESDSGYYSPKQRGVKVASTGVQFEQHFLMQQNSRHQQPPTQQQQPCIYFTQQPTRMVAAAPHGAMVYSPYSNPGSNGSLLAASSHVNGLCLTTPSSLYLQPSVTHVYGQSGGIESGDNSSNSSVPVIPSHMQTNWPRYNTPQQQQHPYQRKNNKNHIRAPMHRNQQSYNNCSSKPVKYRDTSSSNVHQMNNKKPNNSMGKMGNSSAATSTAPQPRFDQNPGGSGDHLQLTSSEFPDLISQLPSNSTMPSQHQQPAVKLSYSAIVTGRNQQHPNHQRQISAKNHYIPRSANLSSHSDYGGGRNSKVDSTQKQQQPVSAQKTKKRIKKAQKATKAANEEYAQISNEQENLKNALKKTVSSAGSSSRGEKSKGPQTVLNLGDLVKSLEKQKAISLTKEIEKKMGNEIASILPCDDGNRNKETSQSLFKSRPKKVVVGMQAPNALDSTAPLKRGKEREIPKSKKPSALKKVILKEREEKKEQRLKLLLTVESPETDVPPFPQALFQPPDLSVSSPSPDEKEEQQQQKENEETPTYINAECEESNNQEATVAGKNVVIETIPSSVPQIHSRRYREYCCQMLEKEIDDICAAILQKLVFFQDRMYHNDPIKAKSKRRLVLGLREVAKHLKLKNLKCVIISPNLEKIQSKGGLDDAMNQILNLCEEQKVTYVFALGRKAMGCAVGKLVPVSIVGIFDHSGVGDLYKKLVQLVRDAQQKYKEMISIYQQEIIQANSSEIKAVTSGGSRRFAHMTHSRNPSAASCISFASFISEPISELNEASNWRMLMEAISDNTSPLVSLPPEESNTEEEEESKQRETTPADEKDVPAVDCKSSNGTIIEGSSATDAEEEIVDKTGKLNLDTSTATTPSPSTEQGVVEVAQEEEMIKSLDEQQPHDRISSWLQNSAPSGIEDDCSPDKPVEESS